ncbi:uncharacterized protein [Ptychodera flava]|uniref:uncharacterized protein n=1 Tax=Ptychodera flava TaxID=63121 RepID=UPI003969EB26
MNQESGDFEKQRNKHIYVYTKIKRVRDLSGRQHTVLNKENIGQNIFNDGNISLDEKYGRTVARRSSGDQLVIEMECKELGELDNLWNDMANGELTSLMQSQIVTREVLSRLDVEEITLETYVKKWEYSRCWKDITYNLSDTSSNTSSEDRSDPEDQLEVSQNPTKPVINSLSEDMNEAEDRQEELQNRKGSSIDTVLAETRRLPEDRVHVELSPKYDEKTKEQIVQVSSNADPARSRQQEFHEKCEIGNVEMVSQAFSGLAGMDSEYNLGFLVCLICSKQFKNPRILECYHSFCEHCLLNLDLQGGNMLKCPKCGDLCRLPPGGVSALPINNMLKEKHASLDIDRNFKKTCEICEEKETTHVCIDCDFQSFCEKCANFHLKARVSASHKTLTLQDYKKQRLLKPFAVQRVFYCTVHSTNNTSPNPIKFYCDICKIPVCIDHTNDSNNVPSHLKKVYNKYTKDLIDWFDKLTKKLSIYHRSGDLENQGCLDDIKIRGTRSVCSCIKMLLDLSNEVAVVSSYKDIVPLLPDDIR